MNDKKMVIVDAGHGGIDSGASGNGLREKDLTLRAALYMYNRLKELGVPVAITRTDDESLTRRERINNMLKPFGNGRNVIIASNHINAGGAEGAEVIYSLRNNDTLASSILDEIGKKGQIKRKVYQRRLPENPSKDYYYIMRLTPNTEALLIEYGFIDNKNDSLKLKNNLEDYVEGAVKAITEYAGYNYVPKDNKNNTNNSNIYVVSKNDTLYSIAKKFNTTVNEIVKLNNLSTDDLYIGEKLIIPYDDNNVNDSDSYVVKKGDTLWSIASNNGLTVNELIKINNLSSNNIIAGQKLKLPKESVYVVKKGDTLYSIASKYNTNVNSLMKLNNLSDYTIVSGQKLKVKDLNSDSRGFDSYISIKEHKYHKVVSGESIFSVAASNGLSVSELKKLNNLESNAISIGDNLIIY